MRDEQENDLPQVRVTIDGVPAKPSADGRIVLDPGTYRFRFESSNLLPQDKIVSVRLGEKLRMVSVTMHAPRTDVSAIPTPAAVAPVATPAPVPLRRQSPGARFESAPASRSAWDWSGLERSRGSGLRHRASTTRLRSGKPNCATDKVNTVNQNFVGSYIGLGAGIVGVATSAVLLGWSYAVDNRAADRPVAQVGGGMADLSVSF